MPELVKGGESEALDFAWETTSGATATTVEVRAYIYESNVQKYWNGSIFDAADATLTSTSFSAGRWRKTDWTWPTAWIGKTVEFEAKATAPTSLAPAIITRTVRVVAYLNDSNDVTVVTNG